ncbi:RNA polymerase II transcriptional coactivator [Metopolophium dirhodum]|uniref:RNA polymerase II transcriptional coactivator n=1 Tax=Metopolophium dirhodum TaxID=44670 RepID=UPI0029905D07|nr:RNA polymerase II transcriptional coactivator [Metopolophium dirhodum]
MAPKKSKRSASESSSSDSGPDDRNPPPKKSKPSDKGSSKKTSSNEEEHSFALDKNRFVKVREFRGKLFIDIREFYEKDGETLPGKKGISLSVGQWNKLKEQIDDIQESVEKLG